MQSPPVEAGVGIHWAVPLSLVEPAQVMATTSMQNDSVAWKTLTTEFLDTKKIGMMKDEDTRTSRISAGLMPPTTNTNTAVHSDSRAALGATAPARGMYIVRPLLVPCAWIELTAKVTAEAPQEQGAA
eukprot:1143078-Pelagomonas_calceolata.AAC.2